MSAIGPGDWLECTRSDESQDEQANITAGGVYRCTGFLRAPIGGYMCTFCGALMEEAIMVEPWPRYGWCACSFKPAGYRPSAEVLQALASKPLVDA